MGKVGVVTGGNRGLGFALVKSLCQVWGNDGVVYLTARDAAKGRAAVEALNAEGLHPAFSALDITEDESVTALAEHIRATHGGIDVLIQNAAYAPAPDAPAIDEARAIVSTNNHGTYRVLRAFQPLFRTDARILVVASSFGTLASLDPRLHSRFCADDLAPEDVERRMDEFVAAVEDGRAKEEGWPDWVNIPSKVGQVALTRAFAQELARDATAQRGVLVNAVCPGWTWTEASRPYLERMPKVNAKMPDESAVDVIWLATLPPNASKPYGELVQYREVVPFK